MSGFVSLAEARRRQKRRQAGGEIPVYGPDKLAEKFGHFDAGVFELRRSPEGEPSWQFVCGPLHLVAETQSVDGKWGLVLEWQDRSGQPHRQAFPRSLFSDHCKELRAFLADHGLTLDVSFRGRTAFAEYLGMSRTDRRAIAVSTPGWHEAKGRLVYVMAAGVIGERDTSVLLQGADPETPFRSAGTLADWRRQVAAYAVGNPRLAFSIAAAFAGPTLSLIGADTVGYHWRGASRSGKSTLLTAAASVWGGSPKAGASDFVGTWRSTSAGLEGAATKFNDALICLDELSQADAAMVAESVYLLGNGSGKTRADRSGLAARPPARWRLIYLSSGETSIAAKAAEAKRHVSAGIEARLVELAADAGYGMGVFASLCEFETPDELALAIRAGTRRLYGTAAPAFLEWLVEQMDQQPTFVEDLRRRIDDLLADWLAPHLDAGAQVKEVARRFAIVAIAGEFGIEASVLPWTAGYAAECAHLLFNEWVAERGTLGGSEDRTAVERLARFIGRHGASRFETWKLKPLESMGAEPLAEEAEPNDRMRTIDRVGWRRWTHEANGNGEWCYFVTQSGMQEALEPLDFRTAIKALIAAGMIQPDPQNKSKTQVRPPGVGKPIRLYVVPGHAVGGFADDGAD